MHFLHHPASQSFIWGIISAASLPMGAILARFWIPKNRVTAVLMAFGGGALLSALTIDLVAESVRKGDFFPLAIGAVAGSLIFIFCNQIVNSKGGFLRKMATTVSHLRHKKLQEYKYLFQKLSRIQLFNALPPEEIQALVPYISRRTYQKGRTIIRQGDPGDSLFIVDYGVIDILDEKNAGHIISSLKEDDVLGEMALMTGEPRSASAVVSSEKAIVWVILKEHFDRLLSTSPAVATAVTLLVRDRIGELQSQKVIEASLAEDWSKKAVKHLDERAVVPTETEIKEAGQHESGAPLAIWLGLLLDGIPESAVIGTMITQSTVSLSLIAGLFLSNFPESLSSSVGMRQRRYSFGKIFWMWTSLMLICGVCACLGNVFFTGSSEWTIALVEGLAAGAMLTVIAETMLPEAYHQGGAVTGISTLLGFLAAIFFKTLE